MIRSIVFFVLVLMLLPSSARADEMSEFNAQMKAIQTHRDAVVAKLGLQWVDTYPHVTCYYDDLEHHYELDQLMRDKIAEGL